MRHLYPERACVNCGETLTRHKRASKTELCAPCARWAVTSVTVIKERNAPSRKLRDIYECWQRRTGKGA